MTKLNQVYKCKPCGNIVEVIHTGRGILVCCGEPMLLLEENTEDASNEKHVPVVDKIDGGYRVTVGSVAHPMVEKHYIEWVQLMVGDRAYRQFLKAGEAPQAEFAVDVNEGEEVYAREYCNLHGLWKGFPT